MVTGTLTLVIRNTNLSWHSSRRTSRSFLCSWDRQRARASCGGVLIFRGGSIRALFSGPVNGDCRIYAGIAATREAVNLIIIVGWSGKSKFVLVFDSLTLSNWFAFPLQRPWKFFNSLAEFDALSIKCKKLKYTYVPKEENGMSVHLAMDGLPRLNCFSAWW
ncbi:hypothetical protein V6N13_009315 [Hibiscus sabdariffa]